MYATVVSSMGIVPEVKRCLEIMSIKDSTHPMMMATATGKNGNGDDHEEEEEEGGEGRVFFKPLIK